MAHHKPEEEYTSSKPVEEAKEVVLPIHHGSTSSCAEEKSRCLLPARSLRSTTTAIPPAAQAQSQQAKANDGRGIRSLSFSKLLSFRLPPTSLGYIDRLVGADDAAAAGSSSSVVVVTREDKEEGKLLKQICRSQSVPLSMRGFNVVKAAAGLRRVGPAAAEFRVVVSDEPEDHIAVEEAVCRICMVPLSDTTEGGAVMKLECCCKGELALAHKGCAIKWFSIKGNRACDVCGQEVLNLPVTLLVHHSHHPSSTTTQAAAAAMAAQATPQSQQQAAPTSSDTSSRQYRVWHGTPILVIISMLAYFCFLEQLLVGDHGTAALAISLPFACVLGLFSSLTTAKMVSRRYVWIYSAVQFLFIVLFTNLFYRYVRVQAVIAIILSTFAGFSVAICANYVLLHILRWRARRLASPTITEDQQELGGQTHGGPETVQPLPQFPSSTHVSFQFHTNSTSSEV